MDVQHGVRPVRSNETVIKACKTTENIRGEDQGFEDGVERTTDDDGDERGGEERRWEERGKKGMGYLEASSPSYIPAFAC